ncbi:MAG: hypothetical protein IT374_27360 [Polyangiaceae bacterium]|nr:hypothetical protein [Polyangiaceae bacterium]
MTRVAVAPNKYARGVEPGRDGVPAIYVVRELREALTRVYRTDAHLVSYVVDGATRQPRINKPGLDAFDETIVIEAFFCDVDNPAHGEWTDETFALARDEERRLPSLATAGTYHTKHGRRIVQPLAQPLDVRVAEAHLRRWLFTLESDGLAVDWRCADWTRHFRLPNVPRELGGRSRCIDLDRMTAIALPPLPEIQLRAAPSRERLEKPRAGSIVWTTELPPPWRPLAEKLAPAVRAVTTEWHSLFMAIAGALLGRGVPPEHVPALCAAVSVLTGADDRSVDRLAAARTTVERWRLDLPVTGYGTLARSWPDVAAALDDGLARGRERRARDLLSGSADRAAPRSLTETTLALEAAIRSAPDGLTLIQAGCGLGKTRAAERVATERASRAYATRDAQGLRAPPQSKTGISVDKHALARQVVRHLRVLGTDAAWHHGPLAKLDADGKPECKYADVAAPLVAGGQPMQWVLCRGRDLERCEHFATCTAKDGYEGPEHPRVHVGPHALLSTLDGATGSSGLLVLDEPPPLLETLTFTPNDFATAFGALDCFDGAYGAALRPALESVGAWLSTGTLGAAPTDVVSVVAAFAQVVDAEVLAQARRSSGCVDGDAVACARAAPVPEDGPPAPPLRWEYVALARRDVARARRLGAASRVLRAVHHALTSESPVAVRIEARGTRRVLHLTRVREDFVAALRREGAVVVLDANVDIWAPVYTKVVGYERPVQRFHAPDGAPVERTLHRLGAATRTAWLSEGRLRLAPTLRTAVRTAIEWARERPGNGVLAIIAIHVVELALRAALAPDDGAVDAEWIRAGQLRETLERVRAELGPVLRGWRGRFLFGHYGALRGLDEMAEADSLVTLGDPWVNIEQVRHECAYLGLEDWEARLEAMCRAELEQAHGRLRTVHRTRPGRALHVGTVAPGGAGWEAGALVRRTEGGRPKRAAVVGSADLLAGALDRLGSATALARELGCDRRTLRRYLAAEHALPEILAAQLASLLAPEGGRKPLV